MYPGNDISDTISSQLKHAYLNKTRLQITGGGSKFFYGNAVNGEQLDVTGHNGIIEYHPSELVITARCGTKLSEIEKALDENNQMLAFEPPIHSQNTTFGGTIATGLSGPRRAYSGSARDFVLGAQIINGKGEKLKFGGQVMKNVAGYDASRLMVGAQGTLGVILDISVKVLPKPESELTIYSDRNFEEAHINLRDWILQGHPISASCYYEGQLFIRLSSTDNSTKKAHKIIGGDIYTNDFWGPIRHQTHDFFTKHKNIWRVSVPASSNTIAGKQPQLIEWNGGLRWVASDDELFTVAQDTGGHACRYPINAEHSNVKTMQDIFQPLPSAMFTLHQRIKRSFDPENILNPGRIYSDL